MSRELGPHAAAQLPAGGAVGPGPAAGRGWGRGEAGRGLATRPSPHPVGSTGTLGQESLSNCWSWRLLILIRTRGGDSAAMLGGDGARSWHLTSPTSSPAAAGASLPTRPASASSLIRLGLTPHPAARGTIKQGDAPSTRSARSRGSADGLCTAAERVSTCSPGGAPTPGPCAASGRPPRRRTASPGQHSASELRPPSDRTVACQRARCGCRCAGSGRCPVPGPAQQVLDELSVPAAPSTRRPRRPDREATRRQGSSGCPPHSPSPP